MTAAAGPPREPDACSAPYRVRFDEAGPDGRLRTSVLMRYAQDLAWFHSASLGFTREWYAERDLVWLARAAEVTLLGDLRVGDGIVGTTRVVGWRRVWARRRTEFVDGAGALVAWTHVDWVLLDGRGAPTRVPPIFESTFGVPGTRIALSRVSPPATPSDTVERCFAVRPQELDPMDHVNNAVYADWLDEVVLAGGGVDVARAVPRTARLEYAGAAAADDTIRATAWRDADAGWWCRIASETGVELLRARLERG